MTSRKSLSDKKKGALYSFSSALKTASLPGGFLVLLFVGLFGFFPFSTLYDYEHAIDFETGNNIVRKAKEYYKFLVFMDGDETDACYLMLAAVAIMSVAVGIAVFRFTADKRTVNVYYSLGIKRTTLFYSRYFAGALTLCLAVAIGVVSSYIVNLVFLGGSWQLSVVLLYLYCGLSLFSLLIFSVTAAVFACVGTVSEGVLYSLGILALPTVLLLSAESLISSMLSNTVYGMDIAGYELTGNGYYYGGATESLILQYAKYNPVLFFYNGLVNYGAGCYENDKLLIGAENKAWTLPSLFDILPWFFVVVAVAFLGGAVLFRLRKAEHCGFLNTNKVLSTVVLFELMFFAVTVLVGEDSSRLAFGAGLAALMYVIFEIYLERNVRLFFRNLWKLPALGLVIAAVFAVFSTGLFGYESYVPAVENVENVCVSVPVSQSQISLKSTSGTNMSGFISYGSFYVNYELPPISDAQFIKTVTEVHKNTVDRKDADYVSTVSYTLKNGKTVKRSMLIDNDDIKKLFTLFDSAECKDKLNLIINAEYPENPTVQQLRKAGTSMFRWENATVTAISRNMSDANTINLTKAEFNSLKQAVLKDLISQTAESYFNGTSTQIGVLRFTTDIPEWDDIYVPEKNKSESFSSRLENAAGQYSDFGYETYDAYGRYDVLVDESMTNTLSYLKSIGAAGCFDTQKKIKSVSFRSVSIFSEYNATTWSSEWTRKCGREFFASSVTDQYGVWSDASEYVSEISENIITDSGKIKELEGLMKLHAYTYGEGYWCLVKYEDGTFSAMYLDEQSAPDYVKNFEYQMMM